MSILAVSERGTFNRSRKVSGGTYQQFTKKAESILTLDKVKDMQYLPIRLYISIRNAYSNDVIVNSNGVAVYEFTPEMQENDKDTYNFILLGGKMCILDVFSNVEEQDFSKLVFSTTCLPIGATFVEEPIILAHIILRDTPESYQSALNSGYSFKSIKSLVPKSRLQKSMYDRLIVIGGDK